MILLPAIDLMDGKVVRLRQGDAEEKTIYSDDPVAFALRWQEEGGDYLHIVDLDAAFTGEQKNLAAVHAIVEALDIPCELGGGMRSEDAIARALDAGVERVIIGTRAAESLKFVEDMANRHGSHRIAVGIDAKNGEVSVRGWTRASGLMARDFAQDAQDAGAGTIIYTDIATDGMLTGPNFNELDILLGQLSCQLIASGGVANFDDVQALNERERLYGVIIGKALYDRAVSLAELKSLSSGL